jgi:hypothetical protein
VKDTKFKNTLRFLNYLESWLLYTISPILSLKILYVNTLLCYKLSKGTKNIRVDNLMKNAFFFSQASSFTGAAPSTQTLFQNEMLKDEKILWSGRPKQGFF